ncbi:imidazolonepropionase [Photobacterium aquae]|uniref:Imidazolonepropionase n=1 Tax=Photobacterium aquae TaxID=1195763 RepID=A0A0J1JMT2_9GAMM|nr:imidazolonepropionase [Photobacterium aquae]KLV03462.1 imidazolonepropionase [Photobacterium aquae]
MGLLITNANLTSATPGETGYAPSTATAIAIHNGLIAAIGDKKRCLQALSSTSTITTIDVQGQLITPGLIDCHTHLVFAGNRAREFEQRLSGVSYQTIAESSGGILATVSATREASEETLYQLANERLQGFKNNGVTTIEIKSGYGLTLADECKMLRVARRLGQQADIKVVTTLLAAHAIPPEFTGNADGYIDHICQAIIPAVANERLADAVDVFCEKIAFTPQQCRRVFETARNYGLAIKGHTEQLSNMGGSALAARLGAYSVDHIEYLDTEGVAALAACGTVATLLPGAFYFLGETQLPPIDQLRRLDVPMAIASDFNPGTSPIASLRTIMNMACTLYRLTPEECLRGVTIHAAKALGLDHDRGEIRVGMAADLAIWRLSHPAELSYCIGVPDLTARIVDGHYFPQAVGQYSGGQYA